MAIVSDDGVHEDEFSYTVAQLPSELTKEYYASKQALESPTEATGALKSTEGSELPVVFSDAPEASQEVRPEPFGLNPPPSYLDNKPEPKPEAKVLFKTKTGIEITDQDIQSATDVAMSFGTGTIGGVVSKTIDKGALSVAQAAEKEGLSALEIYEKTGFFKGADKRWRYEIDDSGSKWKPPQSGQGGPLHMFLDHPELYKAYPELKNIKITNSYAYSSKGAEWDGARITMGDQAALDKGIVMHEVQHAIQDLEMFAKGGVPGKQGQDYKLRYEDDINKLRPKYLDLLTQEREGKSLKANDEALLDYLKHVFKKYSEYSSAGIKQARENYYLLAGEAEARNVQTRVDLNPIDRYNIDVFSTLDVPMNKQIVSEEAIATSPYLKSGMHIKKDQVNK